MEAFVLAVFQALSCIWARFYSCSFSLFHFNAESLSWHSTLYALREAYTIFDHFFKKIFFHFILHLEACSRCIPSFSAFQGSTTKLCAIWSMLLYSIISRVRRNLREAGVRRNLREAGNRSGHLCVKYTAKNFRYRKRS